MKADGTRLLAAILLTLPVLNGCSSRVAHRPNDWPAYGGGSAGDRYSELGQIDRSNVHQLQVAWRFDTGLGGLQTHPLVVGDVLYGYTPTQSVIALDAATGALRWKFDPGIESAQPARGLSYWSDGKAQRLFASNYNYLYALDPVIGQPIESFGEGGKIDLRKGLGRDYTTIAAFLTSPGVVYKDLIIVGFRTSEAGPAAPGAVRAYDVRTGKMQWIFNLIPRPGEAGYETWPADAWKSAGGTNAWAGMVVDEERGIVYAPTGSAVDDFYGGRRKGDNLYASSLVALDAGTGKYLWHFQGVHHDIFDRDFPSPPVLLTVKRNGRLIDAVAQPSKQGFVFLFDRMTGEPLFPIEERPVPHSDIPGEQASATQPAPLKPFPFARQRLTEDLLTTRTREAHAAALTAFKTFRTGGPFTPMALGRKTVVFPGFDGGAEWGGAAVDRTAGVIYINSNDIAWIGSLAERAEVASRGEQVYQAQCAGCHGLHREGSPPTFPSLVDVGARLRDEQIVAVILKGRGRMPGFPQIPQEDFLALFAFLRSDPRDAKNEVQSPSKSARQPDYVFTGYKKFYDADGYPAVAPPWGTLNAIDLNTGEYLWKVPLGEYPELAARGMKDTGTENYGGPIVTAGGLVFIGATLFDRKIHAFDKLTGDRLWEADLPYAGMATPVTYMIDGRQYVAIAASGQRNPKGPQGSAYVAFALPRK